MIFKMIRQIVDPSPLASEERLGYDWIEVLSITATDKDVVAQCITEHGSTTCSMVDIMADFEKGFLFLSRIQTYMSEDKESINMEWHHVCRPLCRCCGGGENRKGYTHTKATSRYLNANSRRSKPKRKDHR